MEKKLAIGVLAFNEEPFIKSVLTDLIDLNVKIYIVNDSSTDNTLNIIKEFSNFNDIEIINNEINLGAGLSTKKLIDSAYKDGYKFLIKVDGDGQFQKYDVIKIIQLYKDFEYEFIKSNRFWLDGIVGKIPNIRFFGNLLATLFFQFSTGSNKLYDPLNGLFGISTKIKNGLADKHYPNRYGYPFFISAYAVINNFKTYQINNTVEYKDEKSNLNSVRVFITIINLTIKFYFKKLNDKKRIGVLQKSALQDILALFFLAIAFLSYLYIILITFLVESTIISSGNLLLLAIAFTIISFSLFIISFKGESEIRSRYIETEINWIKSYWIRMYSTRKFIILRMSNKFINYKKY